MDFIDAFGNKIELPKDAVVEWRVSAYAVIVDDRGRLLFVEASNGQWEFPGGPVIVNETIAAAVVRECLEETGYHAQHVAAQPIYMNEQRFYDQRAKSFHHSLQLYYRVNLASNRQDQAFLANKQITRGVKWMSLADMGYANAHATIHPLLDHLRMRHASGDSPV